MYQGKFPNSNTAYKNEYGKTATPLMIMLDDLPEENKIIIFYLF